MGKKRKKGKRDGGRKEGEEMRGKEKVVGKERGQKSHQIEMVFLRADAFSSCIHSREDGFLLVTETQPEHRIYRSQPVRP